MKNQHADLLPSEMMRLNLDTAPTSRERQSTFGLAGDDLAGFFNDEVPTDLTVSRRVPNQTRSDNCP